MIEGKPLVQVAPGQSHRRFGDSPWWELYGSAFPVAERFRVRLLGLSRLDLAEAPPGLLIPRCGSVHTFGMRFPLDLHFLDDELEPIAFEASVGPGRVVRRPGAWAILEIPVGRGARPPIAGFGRS